MGAVEGGLIALVILFYIVRSVYRGLRWLLLGARRMLVPPQRDRTAGVPLPSAPSRQVPTQPAVVPRQEPRLRRPEADTAAVRQPATDDRFREQVAQMGADQGQARRAAERVPRAPVPDRITLRPNGNELVRALIWQEILSPPRSQRGRHRPPQ
jgi:hypothetical protein